MSCLSSIIHPIISTTGRLAGSPSATATPNTTSMPPRPPLSAPAPLTPTAARTRTLPTATSTPQRNPKLPSSPRGPRPLTTTPRRTASPLKPRPHLTPSPARRRPLSVSALPRFRVIPATPTPAALLSPPRRHDRQPDNLGTSWAPTPLSLRIRVHFSEGALPPSSPSPPSSPPRAAAFCFSDVTATHAGLLEDLVLVATAEDADLAKISTEDMLDLLQDLVDAIPEEDRAYASAIIFGEKDELPDLEDRNVEELQDTCMRLAEEIQVVDGYLRLMNDDSTF